MLYDLRDQRQRALKRVLASIAEQERLLKEMSLENPHRYLVVGVLKNLRSAAHKLDAGLRVTR